MSSRNDGAAALEQAKSLDDPKLRFPQHIRALEEIFSGAPVQVSSPVGSAQWSREYLKKFADPANNSDLLEWARKQNLPECLLHLSSSGGSGLQFLPIFEALHESVQEVAFRVEHLSPYRRQLPKYREMPAGEFVGPYDMPSIGRTLPLLPALIAVVRWPNILDEKRPERRPENRNWKLERQMLGVRETRSWHW